MQEETTASRGKKKPRTTVDSRGTRDLAPKESRSTRLAGRLADVFTGLRLWDWLIILSVIIALTAFIVEWQRGLVLEYFRQGRPFDRFALVLLAIVFLPRQFERFGLPGMLGLILAGLVLGPNGIALARE